VALPQAWQGWRASAPYDFAVQVWATCVDDDLFFLASGIAFNILLVAIPFCLLLVSGLGYLLNLSAAASMARLSGIIDRLFPAEPGGAGPLVHGLLRDIVRARGTVGLYSAIAFVWFTTRMFRSLRGVLTHVFDIEADRGLVEGKVFDVAVTLAAMLLLIAYVLLSAYLAIATTRGVALLATFGVQRSAMGTLAYAIGQLVAFLVIVGLLFAVYKFLPKERVSARVALVAAATGAIAFELLKVVFAVYLQHVNPASFFTASLAAIVIVLIWVYFVAATFVFGAEVGRVYDLRTRGVRGEAPERRPVIA
jgi:membrane protein